MNLAFITREGLRNPDSSKLMEKLKAVLFVVLHFTSYTHESIFNEKVLKKCGIFFHHQTIELFLNQLVFTSNFETIN